MAPKKTVKKTAAVKKTRDFFSVPEVREKLPRAATEATPFSVNAVTPDYRMRLGGVPLETKAGFELISLRLRQLISGSAEVWQEIERDEHGSFYALFRKYHVPLLLPTIFFFCVRELVQYASLGRFLKHLVVYLPVFVTLYAAYIFLIGIIAEETAEHAGGRFSPQSGMRIALFSSLILSFFSVALFLPIGGMPLFALGFVLHLRQLFAGARTVLNLNGSSYRLYRLSHVLVWAFLGLSAFALLSVASLILSKLGFGAL